MPRSKIARDLGLVVPQLEEELYFYQMRYQELEQRVFDAEATATRLREQMVRLEERLTQLEEQLQSEPEEDSDSLASQVEFYKNELAAERQRVDELASIVYHREDRLHILTQELDRAYDKLERVHEREIRSVQAGLKHLAELQEAYEAQLAEKDRALREFGGQASRAAELEAAQAAVKEELARARALLQSYLPPERVQEVEQRADKAEQEALTARQRLEQLQQDLEAFKHDIDIERAAREVAEAAVAQRDGVIAQLQQEVVRAGRTGKSLLAQIASLNDAEKKLRTELAERDKRLRHLESETERLQTQLQQAHQQLPRRIQLVRAPLETEIARLKEQALQREREFVKLETAARTSAELESIVTALRRTLEEEIRLRQETETRLQALQTQLDIARDFMQKELQGAVQDEDVAQQMSALVSENKQLREELIERDGTIEELRRQRDTERERAREAVREELERLQKRVSAQSIEAQALEDLRNQLSQVLAQKEELQKGSQALFQALEQFSRQFAEERDSLTAKLNEKDAALRDAEAAAQLVRLQVDQHRAAAEQAEARLKELQEHLDSRGDAHEQALKGLRKALEVQKQAHERQVQQITAALEEARKRELDLSRELEHRPSLAQVQELQERVDAVAAERVQWETRLREAEEARAALQARVAALEQLLADRDTRIRELELTAAQKPIEAEESKVAPLDESLKERAKKVAELEKEILRRRQEFDAKIEALKGTWLKP